MRKHIVIPKELALSLLTTKKYNTFSSAICNYALKGYSKIVALKFEAHNYPTSPVINSITKPKLEIDKYLSIPRTQEITIKRVSYELINTFAVNEGMSFSKAISFLAYLGLETEYELGFNFVVDRRR